MNITKTADDAIWTYLVMFYYRYLFNYYQSDKPIIDKTKQFKTFTYYINELYYITKPYLITTLDIIY